MSVEQTPWSEVNTRVLTVNTGDCFCRRPEEVLVIRCRPEQQQQQQQHRRDLKAVKEWN